MADLKEELQKIVTEYNEIKQQINTALRSVLKELGRSPDLFRVVVTDSQENRWAWNVEMGGNGIRIKFQVSAAEVMEPVTDGIGQIIGRKIPDDLPEKIKAIIIRKVKDELTII